MFPVQQVMFVLLSTNTRFTDYWEQKTEPFLFSKALTSERLIFDLKSKVCSSDFFFFCGVSFCLHAYSSRNSLDFFCGAGFVLNAVVVTIGGAILRCLKITNTVNLSFPTGCSVTP